MATMKNPDGGGAGAPGTGDKAVPRRGRKRKVPETMTIWRAAEMIADLRRQVTDIFDKFTGVERTRLLAVVAASEGGGAGAPGTE